MVFRGIKFTMQEVSFPGVGTNLKVQDVIGEATCGNLTENFIMRKK